MIKTILTTIVIIAILAVPLYLFFLPLNFYTGVATGISLMIWLLTFVGLLVKRKPTVRNFGVTRHDAQTRH